VVVVMVVQKTCVFALKVLDNEELFVTNTDMTCERHNTNTNNN
jgi:hypothetical protein